MILGNRWRGFEDEDVPQEGSAACIAGFTRLSGEAGLFVKHSLGDC